MAAFSAQDITRVKGLGFLLNRGTESFSGRVVSPGGVFTADELMALAECAKRFGNGKVIMTTRLAAEVVGIPYDQIEAARSFLAESGLYFGGTGAKVRPVTACKGTTCVYGTYDTQALAQEIHDRYYIGWKDVALPHKFKIAVGGCPNSCMKPSLNDFGIEGHRIPVNNREEFGADVGYKIYVGGTWGKSTRMGTPLSRLVRQDEIFPLIEKTMLWFKENAYQKERLGAAIDRVGADKLEEALFGDDLLNRKEEILAADVKKRP